MNDTPDHIKKLQLHIWLSKPPAERLRQAVEDNAALFVLWAEAKKQLAEERKRGTLRNDDHCPLQSGNY